jgi:hypothetical protein
MDWYSIIICYFDTRASTHPYTSRHCQFHREEKVMVGFGGRGVLGWVGTTIIFTMRKMKFNRINNVKRLPKSIF